MKYNHSNTRYSQLTSFEIDKTIFLRPSDAEFSLSHKDLLQIVRDDVKVEIEKKFSSIDWPSVNLHIIDGEENEKMRMLHVKGFCTFQVSGNF